jgi:hypothetical protein
MWLKTLEKYGESALWQSGGNIMGDLGRTLPDTASKRSRFAELIRHSFTASYTISLTQRSPQKMWVMTRH